MYRARTLNEGEQIILGIEGLDESTNGNANGNTNGNKKTVYAVLSAGKNCQTLTLCMDRAALVDYAMLTISRQKREDALKIAGQMLELNCLQCHAGQFSEQPLQGLMMRFDYMKDMPEGEVVLRRCRAGRLPDSDLNEQEQQMVLTAVDTVCSYFESGHTAAQAAAMLKQSGEIFCAKWRMDTDAQEPEWRCIVLSDHAQIEYPSPVLEDELQVRRVKKRPASGATLICSLRRLPIPVSEDPVCTPVMLAMVDDANGVVGTDIVEDYERDCFALASAYINYMEEFGRPGRVVVSDDRTFGLLGAISQQVGVRVEKAEALPQIDELVRAYMEMVCSGLASAQQETEVLSDEGHEKNGQGICMICTKEFSEQQMRDHIIECTHQQQTNYGEDNLILHISDMDDADYWMDVALKKDATLAQLDSFLREVWTDDSGESMFICNGIEYYSSDAANMGGRSMNTRIFKNMPCGTQLLYDFDFEAVTRLKIDVIGEFKAEKRRKKAVQLARNIQPQYACVKCGRKADFVSERTEGTAAQHAYCEKCGCTDSEISEALLPILNSPRCGKRGYGAWMYI